ncbi:MAG: DUF2283 domain-containing protein [Myxococcales bacterium]|nr:DUF2283 domain-containing protein [Myxococcales bacterium]
MSTPFLEISFQHGKPFAAYLRLPRADGTKVARSREVQAGLVVDFAADGAAMGVEIINPAQTRPEDVLAVLADLAAPLVSLADLAPLHAA